MCLSFTALSEWLMSFTSVSLSVPATLLHWLTLPCRINLLQSMIVQQQTLCGMHIPVVQYIHTKLPEPF